MENTSINADSAKLEEMFANPFYLLPDESPSLMLSSAILTSVVKQSRSYNFFGGTGAKRSTCKYYGFVGHMEDKCYKKYSCLPKSRAMPFVNKCNAQVAAIESNLTNSKVKGQPQDNTSTVLPLNFTKDQYEKILTLIQPFYLTYTTNPVCTQQVNTLTTNFQKTCDPNIILSS